MLPKKLKLLSKRFLREIDFLTHINRLCSKRLTLPNFMCIDPQKDRTSWLYRNLKCRPDVYLPKKEYAYPGTGHEIHYFDWCFEKRLEWYSKKFREGEDRIKRDVTPRYSIISKKRIKFIKTIIPDLRIISILRNPIERAWLQALKNLEKIPKIDSEEVPVKAFIEHLKSKRSILRRTYLDIIGKWRKKFFEEKILIKCFDAIKNTPKNILHNIFMHIGIEHDVDFATFPVCDIVNANPNHTIPPKYYKYLSPIYLDDIKCLKSFFSNIAGNWSE